jgi:hypothetical protein
MCIVMVNVPPLGESREQPIGIVGPVGDQDLGGHLRQQRISAGEIMGLPGVSRKRSGLPSASTRTWILVLSPPLLRPMA